MDVTRSATVTNAEQIRPISGNTYTVTLRDGTELEARGKNRVAAVRSLDVGPEEVEEVVLRERGR